MSLVPLMFSDWWEDLERPHRIFDQHFGHGINPEQIVTPHLFDQYYVPNRHRRLNSRNPLIYCGPLARQAEDTGTSTVKADKDQFQVVLDVKQFEPEEIDVKVVDKCVVVSANHEEKRDQHGWVSRQFVRKYLIPEQCDVEQVASKLSSDGVLTITAPRKDQPKLENGRAIKIVQTGQPAVQDKPAKQVKEAIKNKDEGEKKK